MLVRHLEIEDPVLEKGAVVAEPVNRDAELIAALRARDERALVRFYNELRPSMDRSICRVLGHRECDHEDIVQLTFEQVVDSILRDSFRGQCSLATWAGLIASRISLAELRRRYRRRAFFFGLVGSEIESSVTDEGRIEARAELRRVREALSEVPEKRAEVLLLCDVEQLSISEVARVLNINEGAVHARLVRGRRQLRALLKAAGGKR